MISAELTAKWESYLRKIGNKQGVQEAFLRNIKKFIAHLLESVPKQVADMDLAEEKATIDKIKKRVKEI